MDLLHKIAKKKSSYEKREVKVTQNTKFSQNRQI